MCGIAGVIRRDGAIAPDPSTALLAALAHRGPDGHGVWRSPGHDVMLIHTRLAVIGPGPSGAQPMATPDGRHRIVYNGEVYNFRELRRSLEARGERFTTASDTEVLLRLLTRDGAAALAQIRGMFALGWWDAETRELVLARDRFGIKPLYVAVTDKSIGFASEIHALLAANLVERAIDPAGVLGFLEWGTVPPSLTYLAGVENLAAGSWLRWSDGECARGTFAGIAAVYARPHSNCSESTLRQRAGAAVQQSVAAHLVADVPVGVFLSGGIDSSAILSAATNAGVADINTYTVRFDDRSSEHEYASLVASTFGATHHELVLDPSRIVSDLPSILTRLDQPTLDAVNSYYVSAAVAATGIKAVLSGSGGDEMFGGYPSFRRLPFAMRWKGRVKPLMPALAPLVSSALPQRLTQRWQHFASGNGRMNAAYRTQRGLYMPGEVAKLAGPALRDRWAASTARLAAAESLLFEGDASTLEGDVARLETRVYLASQLLRDLDVMSMAHGLEVRVPFVDHVLLDEVWPDLGAHPSLMRNKRLLHETLARPLPRAATDRPKQTFTLPFATWMAADLQPFVRSGMAHLADAGWIAPSVPDETWRAWQRGDAHWSRPWALAMLGEFLRAI